MCKASKQSKEQRIDQIIRERKIETGLVAVLCVQETCRTVKLRYGQQRPRLEFAYRPQRVLYYYFLDKEFGRVHVRIQTWFPFNIQICLNGREGLARQMDQEGIRYQRKDNCFRWIENLPRAQQLLDAQLLSDWPQHLERLAKQINPVLEEVLSPFVARYYWTCHASE